MDDNFRKMMKWYGKIFTDYHLYAGNFLEKTYEDVKTAKDATFDWRAEATVIFVNNFAFNEDLNLQVNLYQMIIWWSNFDHMDTYCMTMFSAERSFWARNEQQHKNYFNESVLPSRL